MSEKFDKLSASQIRSKRKTTISQKISFGTDRDTNYGQSKLNPTNFLVGSAYTQGQVVRSLYDLNNNGPILYSATELDKQNILTTYESVFNLYPNLTNYPYLSLDYADPSSAETLSRQYPIFKYSGKGFGEVEFYNVGSQTNGLIWSCDPQYLSFYYTNIFRDRIFISEPQNWSDIRFPYCGLIYSGNLVQLKFEENGADSRFQNIKVIPYQSGRGIPQYDPLKEYFSGDAYGTPKWLDFDLAISPELSMGCVTGNNDACLGISMDTQSMDPRNNVYRYRVPNGYTLEDLNRQKWMKWDQHPAPFTAPSVNVSFTRTERILSPENSNDNYYAPWPNYYAYQPNDPIPILHKGVATGTIGAAFNIGAMAYYEPDVAEGDDPRGNPNYVSVSVVPLFQGEEIRVGSTVYASCEGHIITPGPKGTSPYPAPSYCDASGNIQRELRLALMDFSVIYFGIQRDARRDNPWYDWFDPTYGCVGWTGTPNFLLSGIPDQGDAIINRDLSYLNQSNQGSIIVQASTTKNPMDESNGSGRMTLIGSGDYQERDNLKFQRITKFPGTVERSLPVGNSLETMSGTGRWTYTGTILNFEQSDFAIGYGYSTGIYSTIGGTGSGATVNVTAVDSNGSITAATLNSPGIDYTEGDILTLVNAPSPPFGEGTLTFFENSGSVMLDTLSTISLNTSGSGYTSSVWEMGFNISANNLLVEATSEINSFTQQQHALLSFITGVSVYSVTDTSRYPIGTIVAIMNDSNPDNWAQVTVSSNNGTTLTLSVLKRGGRNVYDVETPLTSSTYVYSTQIVGFNHPAMRITADSQGMIQEVNMIDIPNENKEDDLILIPQKNSDKNFIFRLQNNVSRIVNFATPSIKGGAGYKYNPNFWADAILFDDSEDSNNLYGGLNEAHIYNPGQIDAQENMLIGGIQNVRIGTLTQASFYPNISQTYTGEFGNIQTILQEVPFDLDPQPVAGAQPATGWPTFVIRNNTTFLQDVMFFIRNGGTGYSIGGPFDVLGGSGTGMQVYIIKVTDGEIVELKLSSFGQGYQYLDVIVVDNGSGDSEIVLKIPKSREIDNYLQGQLSEDILEPILHFDFEIKDPGTGYIVGGPFDTNLPLYEPFTILAANMQVNILSVGSGGEVTDVEMVLPPNLDSPPPNKSMLAYWVYQLDYNIIIDTGDENCVLRLSTPIKAKLLEFTSQGTNYTTATSVPTFNLSQNNLVTICGLETTAPGECEVIDYAATNVRPDVWDLTRYQVGDVLAFNQNGNVTATAEITAINLANQSITFNQLTMGVGYVQPATSDYGFLPTINLSQTATTVDITADDDGFVTEITNVTLGTNVNYNDALIIEQGDNNVVFQIAGEKDVPPSWQPFTNGRQATSEEWNDFKTVLTSATNLLESRLIIDFDKYYPNYYDNSWYYYGQPDNKDPQSAGYSLQIDF